MGRREYPESAPTIFVHGGCDINDAVNLEFIREKYRLDSPKFGYNKNIANVNNIQHRYRETSSLMSMYSPTGSIAQRLYESLSKQVPCTHSQMIAAEELLKYPTIDFYKTHVRSNDILVIGFLNELNLKIKVGAECFNVSPQFKELVHPDNPIHWLYKDYILNPKYQSAFFETRSLQETKDYLKEYALSLYKIFKDRVIIVDTHIANLYYSNNLKTVIPVTSNSVPFYNMTNFAQNPVSFEYIKKWIDIFIKTFKHYYPVDVPVVSINSSECFRDLNHRFGSAPTHLHPYTINKIGVELFAQLEKISAINSTCEDFSNSQLII